MCALVHWVQCVNAETPRYSWLMMFEQRKRHHLSKSSLSCLLLYFVAGSYSTNNPKHAQRKAWSQHHDMFSRNILEYRFQLSNVSDWLLIITYETNDKHEVWHKISHYLQVTVLVLSLRNIPAYCNTHTIIYLQYIIVDLKADIPDNYSF